MKVFNFKIFFFLLVSVVVFGQQSFNIDLFGKFDRGDERYSGSWIYNGPNGEYALLGTSTGTAIYSMNDSNNIKELAFIPGPKSNWREITVMGNFAYVVTEGKNPRPVGMQVIDLRSLPASASLVTNYTTSFNTAHTVQRDIYSEKPILYVSGSNTLQGVHFIDVSNPRQPKEIGRYDPGYYIHDCFVKNTIMVAAAFEEATFDVVLILRPDNPFVLGRVDDPDGFCHSSFETEDNKYLITLSEKDGIKAKILDIRDEPIIRLAAKYTANPKGLVHNVYIKDSFAIFSHNTEGLRIVDIRDPSVPVEVAYYDTYDGPAGGSHGLWSACPFSKSGKIIGGNREDGLYIWHFDTVFAGRFKGRVFDKKTQQPINNVEVKLESPQKLWYSDPQGRFKGGALSGDYTLTFAAQYYKPFTMPITLKEKDDQKFDVFLERYPVSTKDNVNVDIKIYPNIVLNEIHISGNDTHENWKAVIINQQGKLIFQEVFSSDVLNLSKLPKGQYFIQIYNDHQELLITQKIIKL